MKRVVLIASLVSIVACGSKRTEPGANADPGGAGQAAAAPGKASSMQTYTIPVTGSDSKLKLEIATPSGWTADTSDADGPTFTIDGAQVLQLGFAALILNGDADGRMAKAIRLQYDDAAGARRKDLSGGRVWMTRTEGTKIHSRMFVPFEGGVLMGFALISASSVDRVPEIRSAFETIRITSAPAP